MSRVSPFHSLDESRKTAPRYHTDDACDEAQKILLTDQRPGSGGYYQCEICKSSAEALAATPTGAPES
jgi:hypothetical protein